MPNIFVLLLRRFIPLQADCLRAFSLVRQPLDPLIFSATAALFLVIGFLACYIPALRATRINAIEALRQDGARIVVDRKLQKVWFDGLPIEGLSPGSQAYKFVEMLAQRNPVAVSAEDIRLHISPGRLDGSTTVRQAKTAAIKAIRETLAKAGKEFKDDISRTLESALIGAPCSRTSNNRR